MEDRRKPTINEEIIKVNLEYISKEVSEIKQKLEENYATKADLALMRAEFLPVKVIVFAITSVMGTAAIVQIVKLILK